MARTKTEKKNPRLRSKLRTRIKLRGTEEKPRICVFRSSKHIYAQLISDESGKTIASASTLDKEVVSLLGKDKSSTKSVAAAKAVGTLLAKRVLEKNIKAAKFDRNGFVYTGRIKAVAEGAREAGLEF